MTFLWPYSFLLTLGGLPFLLRLFPLGYLRLYQLLPQGLSDNLAVIAFVGHHDFRPFLLQPQEPKKLWGLTGLSAGQEHLQRKAPATAQKVHLGREAAPGPA